MNLLPKDHSEFVKPEYWDQFFKKRGAKAFEWYGEYPELCGVLHKYIKPQDKVLVIGCGNSQLSADMYDVGYHKIVNIDISDIVVKQMKEKNQKQRPDMEFHKMDVLNMEFPDSEFTVTLDKGTLDALMVDSSEKVVKDIETMFNEIDRVLKPMGRYLCISLLQEHILNKVLEFFSEKGWALRIHRIHTEDSENSEREFHMPVFALVFTKFKKTPGMPQILEVSTTDGKVERFTSADKLRDVIKEMQYYAVIRQRVSKKKVTEDQVSLALYSDLGTSPRYTLTIVDSSSRLVNKFAIFIVPQGRETEWMFSTDAGRQLLSQGAGFERLVVVTLDRNHSYQDLDTIKAELSTKVMELAPPSFKHGTQVPFLSLGEDIGTRTVCLRGHSELSGDYVIEDVQGDANETFRRLVFLSNQNIVQSEAKLKRAQKKKSKGKQPAVTIDKSYLACQHHVAMVTGVGMVQNDQFDDLLDSDLSVLLVGLGGGGLPTYIHEYFPKIALDVVDIDPTMVSIATDWFGFSPDDRMRVHVADGIDMIKSESKKGAQRHIVMLDVDSKDPAVGMSCPPQPFVEREFLETIKSLLHTGGVFILNLVCRNQTLKEEVISRVKSLFSHVFIRTIEDEVNEVVFAVNSDKEVLEKDIVFKASENVRYMCKYSRQTKQTSSSEIEDMFQGLKLL